METENKLDQLFREGLADHRKAPPEALWQHIAVGAGIPAPPLNGNHGSRKGIWWWIPLSIFLTALVGGLILWLASTERPETQITATLPVVAAQDIVSATSAEPSVPISEMIRQNTAKLSDVKAHDQSTPKPVSNQAIKTTVSHQTTPHQPEIAYEAITSTQPVLPPENNHPSASEERSLQLQVKESEAIVVSEINIKKEVTNTAEETIPEVAASPDSTEKQQVINEAAPLVVKPAKPFPDYPALGLALHGGPFFYQAFKPFPEELRTGSDAWMSLDIRYRRVQLTTGAGVFRVTDISPWAGQRMKLDTVGYYQYITGLNFVPVYNPIDSTITGYTAGTITSVNTPAVDTSYHPVQITARHRYTYLTLPLMVGYDLWSRDRITLMVHAGVIFNLQLAENQHFPDDAREPYVILMKNQGLIRKDHLWQYQAGMGLRYDLAGQWYTGIDCAYRRNLSDWYQNPITPRQPNSLWISAKVGIWL